MALLRLLADMLLYLALALLVYWYFTDDIITALWIAIGSGVVSALLFMFTADIRHLQRQRKSGAWDLWDLWIISDLLEIPFRIILWLFRGLWRIFD